MHALSLGFAAVEALSLRRGHMGQRHIGGDPAAEMYPGHQASCRALWGRAVGGMGTKVGCPCLHGSKGHMWCHSVVAVTSLSGSSAPGTGCNSSLCQGECRSHPSLSMVQPGCGEGCEGGSAVAWPAGQGDSAVSFIVTRVLAEARTMPCSPFAVLSCGWLWKTPSCSKAGHSPASCSWM